MEVMMWWISMEAGTRWTYMYMTIYRIVMLMYTSIQAALANASRHVLLRSKY